MYQLFPEWYSKVILNPTQETLNIRWETLNNFTPKIKLDKIPKLITLIIGKNKEENEIIPELNSSFQDSDSTFQIRDNINELRVLASGIISNKLQNSTIKEKIFTSLTFISSCFGLSEKNMENFMSDLLTLSFETISYLSLELRKLNKIDESKLQKLKDFDDTMDLKFIYNTQKELHIAYVNNLNKLNTNYEIVAEESNILWWYFKNISSDLQKRLDELNLDCVSLIIANELSNITHLIPGPINAIELLRCVICNNDSRKLKNKISIQDAVNKVPREWKIKNIKGNHQPLILPITYALEISMSTDDPNDWVSIFNKSAGISAKQKFLLIDLVFQFYQERLLNRLLNKKE